MAKAKTAKAPATDSLLVELLTEELPPKSLRVLGEAFANRILDFLVQIQLKTRDPRELRIFTTPRRLAVLIPDVLAKGQDRPMEITGPSVKVGLGADGKPTPALLGFAKKNGVGIEDLIQMDTPKGKVFACRTVVQGAQLEAILAPNVEDALKRLAIPKIMRWGSGNAEFVRPVHGLMMLHGSRVIPGEVLGMKSSNRTLGHRFLSTGPIALKNANDYERALREKGKVVASFAARRAEIIEALGRVAGKGIELVATDALFDEITALVESPTVYAGEFSLEFLAVPQECLVLSMQQHQKYVPLRDKATGKLLSRFLFVSNLAAKNPREIVHGNERVLNARLSDAKFFFDQDRKTRLEARVPRLANVVYHNKLGSQLERVERTQLLAGKIAREIGADPLLAERAAWLSKADLLTDMVGEFPELQGIMGSYYALHDGEPRAVADAIEAHYRPRFAGDALPEGPVSTAVALADKLDALAGLFGIGQVPSGEKDPFALRRAALGVIRILIEKSLSLDVIELFEAARSLSASQLSADVSMDLHAFFMDRLRPYLRERGYAPDEIDAVLALNPRHLNHVLPRLDAVKRFRALPEGMALSAANKRIRNILRQAGADLGASGYELRRDGNVGIGRNPALLREKAERNLDRELESAMGEVGPMLRESDYAAALRRLAALRPTVDDFFDKVMVMVDDADIRNNRLALLKDLGNLFLRIADVSRLQG